MTNGGSPTSVASVYVHAPFCPRRCVYCDFAVTVRRTGDLAAWLGSLEAELALVQSEGLFALAPLLETVYVGGGTPSLLGPSAMDGLGEMIGFARLKGAGLEWTAEANPESFTTEVAEQWASAGVNRISLGLQSFDEEALRWMGRLHGAEGGRRALAAAGEAGIDNVSVDLIFGLPPKLERSWDDDLARVLDLEVPHVSLYGLTVEPGTALGRAVREGREESVDEEQYRTEFLRASELLTDAGYRHYEVSNFALPGYEARHNAVYWSGLPYLGLGSGAHSFAAPMRLWNEREWAEYRTRLLNGRSSRADREVLDSAAQALESAWLSLRTCRGIEIPRAGSRQAEVVAGWLQDGLAEKDLDRVRLTAEGWLVLDKLTVDFDEVRETG